MDTWISFFFTPEVARQLLVLLATAAMFAPLARGLVHGGHLAGTLFAALVSAVALLAFWRTTSALDSYAQARWEHAEPWLSVAMPGLLGLSVVLVIQLTGLALVALWQPLSVGAAWRAWLLRALQAKLAFSAFYLIGFVVVPLPAYLQEAMRAMREMDQEQQQRQRSQVAERQRANAGRICDAANSLDVQLDRPTWTWQEKSRATARAQLEGWRQSHGLPEATKPGFQDRCMRTFDGMASGLQKTQVDRLASIARTQGRSVNFVEPRLEASSAEAVHVPAPLADATRLANEAVVQHVLRSFSSPVEQVVHTVGRGDALVQLQILLECLVLVLAPLAARKSE